MKRVGVLALQGGYDPHLRMLQSLGAVEALLVRSLKDLDSVDALILPGGESTTIGKLLVIQGLLEPLKSRIADRLPVFGTCAGMILLAREALGRDQPLLGVMDISVERNAYGRQTESFETVLSSELGVEGLPQNVPAVFIRAPRIARLGPGVKSLIRYEGAAVLVREGHLLAASFHPELTNTPAIHEYFLTMV